MTADNTALWLSRPGAPFTVGPADYPTPNAHEVVVRVGAVSVNFIDAMPGALYRFILPWLKFPAVIGSDVAGEVVELGSAVTRLTVGDRVVGHAFAVEKSQNRPAEGAFQEYSVLMDHMVAQIPDSLSFEQASVLPLQLSTAACGLFQEDQLGLALPTEHPVSRNETVVVWGGSTGVGSNAIQLVKNAGYRVITTAGPRNFDYVRSLGAEAVVDYHSKTAVDEVVALIGERPLAGVLAIGSGSLGAALRITSRTTGSKRISSASPNPITTLRSRIAKLRGIRVTSIWGGTLKDNEVGPAIYVDYLPTALASGTHRAAPNADIVGEGLAAIPDAMAQLRKGVSAKKLVVRI